MKRGLKAAIEEKDEVVECVITERGKKKMELKSNNGVGVGNTRGRTNGRSRTRKLVTASPISKLNKAKNIQQMHSHDMELWRREKKRFASHVGKKPSNI